MYQSKIIKFTARLIAFSIPGKSRRESLRRVVAQAIGRVVLPTLARIAARRNRQKFEALRKEPIEKLCQGKRCIVVGSAPDLSMPAHQIGDIVIGANGGAGIAQKFGREVSVLCTTQWLFHRKNMSRQVLETRRILNGLESSVVYMHALPNAAEESPDLSEFGITTNSLNKISSYEEIVKKMFGVSLQISTGMFAVCLATASGAASVEMVGFSLQSGHWGMAWDTKFRDHVSEDLACIEALKILAKKSEVKVHERNHTLKFSFE